jgi:hypothetical protein
MKKILFLLALVAGATALFAQEFTLSGEMKTGVLWREFDNGLKKDENQVITRMGSQDDAGGGPGRFRVNADYFHESVHLGFKVRINWESWGADQGPSWSYAFAYGNFFQDQLTMAIGKLGASPWGIGGPELWNELESIATSGGIRFEYKPSFVPGLNVGFVLNGMNNYTDLWPASEDITFLHYLEETVIGVSYTHQYFHGRVAYRFDTVADGERGGSDDYLEAGRNGGEMLYRLEERIIRNYLPDFRIWAIGYYKGIGASEANKRDFLVKNWLFAEYDPQYFNAGLRFGYDVEESLQFFHFRPQFYIKLWDNFLNIGTRAAYAIDFGGDRVSTGAYYYFEIEPKIQVNFPNFYVAVAYNLRRQYVLDPVGLYKDEGSDPITQTQWLNLRVGMTF